VAPFHPERCCCHPLLSYLAIGLACVTCGEVLLDRDPTPDMPTGHYVRVVSVSSNSTRAFDVDEALRDRDFS
jgi:hypothetical protein